MDNLMSWFDDIQHIKTENAHTISPLIEQEWVDVQDQVRKQGTALGDGEYGRDDQQSIEKKELDILVNVIRKSIDERKSKSILVFAESKKTIDKICEALRLAEIKSLPYYPDIAVQGRAMTLMLFQSQQLPVMVCNNLAARGLDTLHVQHMIQFEFAKTSVDYFHRVGRVGRMGQRGAFVTNFVRRPQDVEIARVIAKQLQTEQNWDKILSTRVPKKKRASHNS